MDKLKAAEELQRIAYMFKGLIEVADQLEQVGKVEQGVKEAEKRKAALEKEISRLSDVQKAAEDSLITVKTQTAEQQSLLAEVERDHRQKLSAETKAAEAVRAKHVADSRAELGSLAKQIEIARSSVSVAQREAQDEADKKLSQTNAQIDQASKELSDLTRKLDAAKKALSKLNLSVNAD